MYSLLIVSKHKKKKKKEKQESISDDSKIASERILETTENFTLAGSGVGPILNYKDSCHFRTEYCFMLGRQKRTTL